MKLATQSKYKRTVKINAQRKWQKSRYPDDIHTHLSKKLKT